MATVVDTPAVDKVWLRSYPPGIPAEVDIDEFANIGDILHRSCERFARLPAFSNMGATIDYATLERLSRDFGSWLQNVAGLKRGDRVAIMMPNVLQYPVAIFGALRAGFVVVNCNPLYTPRELEYQLKDSGAVAIVILENFAHTFAEVAPRTPVRTVVTTALGDLLGFPKGPMVNFVVRHVKKLVRPANLPSAVALKKAPAERARQAPTG